MGNHVFICYAREDEQFVLTFAGDLKTYGVPVWLDRWDIPAGANWQRSIDKAIQDCAKFLIVLSPAAVESEEVEGELRTALDDQKPVVPVLYQQCRIPLRLRSRQYVDLTTSNQNTEYALSRLVHDLGGQSVKNVDPPPLSSPPRPEPVPPPTPEPSPRPVYDKPSPQPEPKKRLQLSTTRSKLWIAVLRLGLVLGVWKLFPTTEQRSDLPVERPKSPVTKETPRPQLPVAVAPPLIVEKPVTAGDTNVGKDGKEMVRVATSEFFMGCNEKVDTECESDKKPGRTVSLSAFSIDKTEVTVAAYRDCVRKGGCSDVNLSLYSSCNWNKGDRKNHPINCVDWNQADAFCKWAGK